MARMTTQNGGPLSLGPFPSSKLKKLKEDDKIVILSPCLSVKAMSVTSGFGFTCRVGWVI